MDIIMTSKNVDYNANGAGYHFGAHFNSNAQILSFNIDVMNPAALDDIVDLFNEEFKPAIYELIEDDIVIPEPPEEEPEEEVEPEGENE